MIRGKRIAISFGSIAGVLGALTVAQGLGVGTGYGLDEIEPGTREGVALAALQAEPTRMKPWNDYGNVLSRPLFNESRAPEIEEATAVVDAAATQPLTVALTGVILTRNMQLALVTDTSKGETERVRVGQPLTGERAGWTLVELKPRLAVFEGAGLGRQELELSVDTHGAGVPAPVMPPPGQAAPQTPVIAQQNPDAMATPAAAPGSPASAEEIRRRIEERRRQLREEAQKMLQQNNPSQ